MKKILLFLSIFIIVSLACDISVNVPSAASPVPLPTNTLSPAIDPATPTPEIFISLTQAMPAHVQLNGVTLTLQEARSGECDLPNCPPTPTGTRYLRVSLQALDLPSGQFIDYKNLPQGIAIHDNTGTSTPFNRLAAYVPATQQLILYFAVPETATVFGLQWPDTAEIPLTVVTTPQQPSSEGVEVSVDSLTITLSPELASSVSGNQIPSAEGQDLPYWELTPGHAVLKLEGYLLQNRFHEPKIYVFPATDYAVLVPGAFESMHRLRNAQNKAITAVSVEELPAVPFFNAAQMFASNLQFISFQNGNGIRFLTEYAQYAAPVNNHDLFYHFQGFTNDGEYYVVAIFPITAPGLAETSDAGAALPVGGIAYPDINSSNPDFQGYYASVTDLLNATSPEAFTPTINKLDMLIQSMRVTP